MQLIFQLLSTCHNDIKSNLCYVKSLLAKFWFCNQMKLKRITEFACYVLFCNLQPQKKWISFQISNEMAQSLNSNNFWHL